MTGASSAAHTRVLVGLMSGTSLDGISAAVVRIARDGGEDRIVAELLGFRQVPYSADQRARLAGALRGVPPDEYCRLNFELGDWLAAAALGVIADTGVPRDEIAAIASHGQTVWHEPAHSTWQFGESAVIAERTGIDVVSDFRVRDVAAAGQGAPLVPIADGLLFSHESRWRALQNIGGIGNVTVVPPGGDLSGVRAFDTGPGVVVVDAVVRRLEPGLAYDAGGALARAGRPIPGVVENVLRHSYFSAEPPKTTGRELFTPDFMERFIDDCRTQHPSATTADIVATAVELTAASIAGAFARFIPEPVSEVLISGGGAKHPVLTERLRAVLAPRAVRAFADVFFDGEAKESVAFALLGYLFLEGRPGNLPRVTGARGPRILGKLTPGRADRTSSAL